MKRGNKNLKKENIQILPNREEVIRTKFEAAQVQRPASVINEDLEEILKKNPKHFFGCGG